MKAILSILPKIGCHGCYDVHSGILEKEVHIDHIHANTYHLKKIVKVGPVDPGIIGLQLKKRKKKNYGR